MFAEERLCRFVVALRSGRSCPAFRAPSQSSGRWPAPARGGRGPRPPCLAPNSSWPARARYCGSFGARAAAATNRSTASSVRPSAAAISATRMRDHGIVRILLLQLRKNVAGFVDLAQLDERAREIGFGDREAGVERERGAILGRGQRVFLGVAPDIADQVVRPARVGMASGGSGAGPASRPSAVRARRSPKPRRRDRGRSSTWTPASAK